MIKQISSAKFYNKPIKVRCIISGKSLAPYCVPKKVKIACHPRSEDYCETCPFKKNKEATIHPVDENILRLIDIRTTAVAKVLKSILGIRCPFSYEITEMQNLERIFVMPPTGKERNKSNLTTVSYYAGQGLELNTVYEMEGYTTVDPTDQSTTHVFTEATRLKSDVDTFALTKQDHSNLLEFSVDKATPEKLFEKLESLYKFYAHNVTKIYHRFDLHLAIDLAFRSVLSFRFDNEFIHKGWSDIAIIGDTRCGKGFVAEKLSHYFGVGEVISGDNCSYAGLVGGLQQYNNNWVVTWGKIPLNDGGLVIVDEASEIQEKDWGRLSRVRSEGVAEITKIHSQSTNARTRLIFIANPPHKTISNYSYGIQALVDIVKAPEDVARFDYVLIVAHNEVAMTDINVSKNLMENLHPSKLEQDLILWTWSKKIENVMFSPEATKLIYEYSNKLALIYAFNIPLIQGENIRLKLAKIAICFAARFYSQKQEGKILFVDKVHVECTIVFLNMIYKKDSSGYYAFSQLNRTLDFADLEEQFAKVEKYFNSYKNKTELCKCLLTNNNLVINDISEHLNQPKEIAREIISVLLKHSCLIKKFTYYVKTPAFTNWLKKLVLKE